MTRYTPCIYSIKLWSVSIPMVTVGTVTMTMIELNGTHSAFQLLVDLSTHHRHIVTHHTSHINKMTMTTDFSRREKKFFE